MRQLKYGVALTTLAWAAVACDGSENAVVGAGNTSNGSGSMTLDQEAPHNATQTPPNNATQPAPNNATQPAPNNATQGAGSNAASSGALASCMTACNHAMALACNASDMTCSDLCSLMQTVTPCQGDGQNLLSCAMAATDCESLESCDQASETWTDCVEAILDPGTDTPPPTTGTAVISDPANCNTASTCGGCVSTCDACVCTLQLANATASQIQTSCGSFCS